LPFARELIGGVRSGLLARSRSIPDAFADFYEHTYPAVLRFFARETREPHRALDLTAETFAKAFEKRSDFRGASDEQAAAWLWTIARTELARYRRSRKIELAALSRLGLERPSPSDEELRRIEELTALEEAHGHLSRALEVLPAEQSDVVRLRFVEHLSYQEIAMRLSVSGDVVRARASRALRALRDDDRVHEAARALEADR
jgi:RNA polymerase sigma-70 factor (ECF subfamily)